MRGSISCLIGLLCALGANAQTCGFFTRSTNFRFSMDYCIQSAASAIFFPGFPTSFIVRCNGTDIFQDAYTSTDCTGTPTTTNVTSDTSQIQAPRQCGGACGLNHLQTFDPATDPFCTATPDFVRIGTLADGQRCENIANRGSVSYCDVSNFITLNFGSGDTTCANNQNGTDVVAIQRIPMGACFQGIRRENCVQSGVTPLVLTLGPDTRTETQSVGLTCSSNDIISVHEYRSEACIPNLGLSWFCGTSGGSAWQYFYQTPQNAIGCGGPLMYAQYVNTGACGGTITTFRPFVPVWTNVSASMQCQATPKGFTPMIDFGSDQWALVAAYRTSACAASGYLYRTYVRADGTCEAEFGIGVSWRRTCMADGSLLSMRYDLANCTGPVTANVTSVNNTCTLYQDSGTITVPGTGFVYLVVESCGGTGMSVINPSDAPGIQRFNTSAPSMSPSLSPTTSAPSISPSKSPSKSPSTTPSNSPSSSPTKSPSLSPSGSPTRSPSQSPSTTPSMSPTQSPSTSPSRSPSKSPSGSPSTTGPSTSPSTSNPSASPSSGPSAQPSKSPSAQPSTSPSAQPSTSPSSTPSRGPSTGPSTTGPSRGPSSAPSTTGPSASPVVSVTASPSAPPTIVSGGHRVGGVGAPFVLVAAMVVAAVLGW